METATATVDGCGLAAAEVDRIRTSTRPVAMAYGTKSTEKIPDADHWIVNVPLEVE